MLEEGKDQCSGVYLGGVAPMACATGGGNVVGANLLGPLEGGVIVCRLEIMANFLRRDANRPRMLDTTVAR